MLYILPRRRRRSRWWPLEIAKAVKFAERERRLEKRKAVLANGTEQGVVGATKVELLIERTERLVTWPRCVSIRDAMI
jgi:hypothetical protein